MNYVEEISQFIKTYSYAGISEASSTHKELCRILQNRLTKIAENIHLANDFLRGPRSSDLERMIRNLKDDIEIFRDEVGSSYIDWKFPRSNILREIINKDAQMLRKSASLLRLSEEMRESALSNAQAPMLAKGVESGELLSKMSYLFSDRERLCR